ncbi:hypothetical protein QBC44DRAFT_371374 [Cladorrhinum sp. PSN332]|nr:hypothetical protein QBC44DRAFT_371374 [Cladorrhinum sp. PSN332]
MPASFNHLAIETVEQILDIIDPPGDSELPDPITLARLNRTSKSLNALTTWRLYRAPRYRYSNWPLFARTVMARRDLAAMVKDLYFGGNVFDDPLDPDKFPEEVATYYLKNMDPETHFPLTTDDPDEETLFSADGDGETSAYIEMDFILNLCRNVETLFVNLMLCHEAFGLLDPPTSLPKLKSVNFGYNNAVDGFAVDHRLSYTILKAAGPSLTKLEISRANSCFGFDFALENVTELIVGYSAISGTAFRNLLSLVPNLEKLEYQGGGSMLDRDGLAEQFTTHEAMEAVEAARCLTLKSFRFDFTHNDIDSQWLSREEVERAREWFKGRGVEFEVIY